MNSKLRITLCAALLFAGSHSLLAAAPIWDYLLRSERQLVDEGKDPKQEKQLYDDALSAALSARGHEGWELVTVIVKPDRYNPNNTITNEVQYVFKRPLP